jgi:hypothetical protein
VEYVLLSNIHVDGAAITFNVNDDSSHSTYVGGILGVAISSVIEECGNSAAITVGASIVGGIAGSVSSPGGEVTNPTPSLVDSCYATGSITTSSANSVRANVGGIAGSVSSYNTVKRSYFAGSITVSRGNDWMLGGGSSAGTMAGVGGIIGFLEHQVAVEDCHSSGVFIGASTNTAGGNNSGIALGGIIGIQWGRDAVIQRCYSAADLNVQRNSNAYAGGIMGLSEITRNTARIAACVALNDGINVECASGGVEGLHRVVGAKIGSYAYSFVLAGNIAWASMPLSTKETGQASQPFTEASADKVRSGVAGEDCDQKPTQSDYTALGWDFSTVWRMGSNGYPELR